jgi:hypothetical protein
VYNPAVSEDSLREVADKAWVVSLFCPRAKDKSDRDKREGIRKRKGKVWTTLPDGSGGIDSSEEGCEEKKREGRQRDGVRSTRCWRGEMLGGARARARGENHPSTKTVAWLLCIKLLGDAEKQWLLEDEGSREEERGRRDLWRSITCQKRCSVF